MIAYLKNLLFGQKEPQIHDNIFGKLEFLRSTEGNVWAGFIKDSWYDQSFELYIKADSPELNEYHKKYYQILYDNWQTMITKIRLALSKELLIKEPGFHLEPNSNLDLNIMYFPKENEEEYDVELNFDVDSLRFAVLLQGLQIKEVIIHN